MFARWIGPCVCVCLISPSLVAQPAEPASVRTVGYLAPTTAREYSSVQYVPQPGDLLFFDDFNRLHHFAYKFSGTGGPTHVGMVIARQDGSLALFDITGSTVAFAKVSVSELDPRLHHFTGMILVRRLKQPLTDEQSRDLTQFAFAQEGKRFAMLRVLLQGTPFNARIGLRHALFGQTYLDRHRWFCSEIVVAGCATAGVFPANSIAGNAVFPRDLAYDETLNLSHLYHPAMTWTKR